MTATAAPADGWPFRDHKIVAEVDRLSGFITLEHCEQLSAQIARYLRTKGKPNVAHDHLRSAKVAIDALVLRVKSMEGK